MKKIREKLDKITYDKIKYNFKEYLFQKILNNFFLNYTQKLFYEKSK